MPATIAPADLDRLRAAGPVLVIDVRTPGEYAREHLADSLLVPLDRLDPATLPAPAAGQPATVHLLCGSGARAAQAAGRIAAAGRHAPVVVAGGISAWTAAGLPVVRGRGAIPLERQVRLIAGSLVLAGVALGWWVHPGWFGLAAFVGAGLVVSGVTGFCGMALLLARLPWNRGPAACAG